MIVELNGVRRDPFSVYNGSIDDCDDLLCYALDNGRAALSQIVYFYRLFAAFFFERYNEAATFANEYRKLSQGAMPTHDILHALFEGLTAFQRARSENDSQLMELGHSAIALYQSWVGHSSWNFQNKLALLEAESHFCKGEHKQAEEKYHSAIQYSRQHRFVQEEGLAMELFAKFHKACGNMDEYITMRESARECYKRWEAHQLLTKDFFSDVS